MEPRRTSGHSVPSLPFMASRFLEDRPPEMTNAGFVVLVGVPAGLHPSKRLPLPGAKKLWAGVKQAPVSCRHRHHGHAGMEQAQTQRTRPGAMSLD